MGATGFTKFLDDSINSSLWMKDAIVVKVFLTFWALSGPTGEVNAAEDVIFRAAQLRDWEGKELVVDVFKKALRELMSPDPLSRSEEQRGRRIVRVSKTKWLIVNYKRIRERTYSDNPESVRKREYRQRERGTKRDTSQMVAGHSASASASDKGGAGGAGGRRVPKGTAGTVQEDIAELLFNNLPDSVRKSIEKRRKSEKGKG